MECKYCKKQLSSKGASHQTYCSMNPNRKVVDRSGEKNPMYGKQGKSSNQYIKAKKEGKEITVSEVTRQKLSKAGKGRRYTIEQRNKMSEIMQRVVREKPESYSATNVNGRSKKVSYKNVCMDSQWEYEFAVWCDKNSIQWEKNKKSFEYEWNGKRLYYPDFFLKDLNRYVEVKGYERERDHAKWESVDNLIIIKHYEIQKIRKGSFTVDNLLSCKFGPVSPRTHNA